MKLFGRSPIAEFLGDRVIYRNLVPCDPRLPALAELAPQAGLAPGIIPRKSEPDYARAVAHLLQRARQLEAPATQIQRLVFIGDTRLNDSTAFDNLCQAGGWPGLAFIGSEDNKPPAVETATMPGGGQLYLANRWTALADFDRYCAEQGFPIDESMAVVVDLDKTALGARGRNAHTIDQARLQAVEDTVAALLGEGFAAAAFRTAYDTLNQVEFHPFTSDNQDYLAYICLALGAGLYDLDAIVSDVRGGRLVSFGQFISAVDERRAELPPGLASIHDGIYANVQAGDPTPFKAFRRNEYLATVGRMGFLGDDAAVEALLRDEIVITAEVRALALDWARRGALLFGLSDKPDEASFPTPEQAQQGYEPIHRTVTHVVGG
ncbi:MAG: hypothetical protein JXA78_13810 [Anaerolineales bacterium]|nr:hypothetical protein [Anaerolineales bacterium]